MFDYQFKVMLLGDCGVGKTSMKIVSFTWLLNCLGKTCLLVRFSDEIFFSDKFFSSLGIDYRTKSVNLGENKINLQIFDTVISLFVCSALIELLF